MSFNDIEALRKGLDAISKSNSKLINAGKRSLLWTIVSYPDGCFIGQHTLASIAGLSLSTSKRYLRELTMLGFIDREQSYARKGVRQCYRVRMNTFTNWVAPVTPKELSEVEFNSLLGITESVKGGTSSPTEYNQLHPYKDNKYNKYDKYDKDKGPRFEVNVERWLVISSKLDPYVVKKWVHTQESERLLDVILERPGMTITALRDRIGGLNFSTSHSNTGRLMDFLRTLAGSKPRQGKPTTAPKEQTSMPHWFDGLPGEPGEFGSMPD